MSGDTFGSLAGQERPAKGLTGRYIAESNGTKPGLLFFVPR